MSKSTRVINKCETTAHISVGSVVVFFNTRVVKREYGLNKWLVVACI